MSTQFPAFFSPQYWETIDPNSLLEIEASTFQLNEMFREKSDLSNVLGEIETKLSILHEEEDLLAFNKGVSSARLAWWSICTSEIPLDVYKKLSVVWSCCLLLWGASQQHYQLKAEYLHIIATTALLNGETALYNIQNS